MNRIFENPTRDFGTQLKNVGLAYLVTMVWTIFIQTFLKTITPPEPSYPNFTSTEPVSMFYIFFMMCICAPIWEEVAFRYGPIKLARVLGPAAVMPTVVLSSIVFGWGHGNEVHSLLQQGVGGLILSWVYIKNGDSIKSSILLHFVWNLTCFFNIFLNR